MTLDSATMRQRFAAQSVIETLLRRHGIAPPLSPMARLFGMSPLDADDVAWYLGAKGEIVVGSVLESLPPDWAVFHALPVGAAHAEIDHILVGPGGIFTITTQHHGGKVVRVGRGSMSVAGRKVSHLRTAEAEAQRVSTLVRERMPLLAPVQPVVALVDPKQLTITEKPEQVKVIDARELRSWLLKLHPVLTDGEVQEVADLMDRAETWRPEPSTRPEDVMARFRALDALVRSAGIRRLLWLLLGLAGLVGAGLASAGVIGQAVAAVVPAG